MNAVFNPIKQAVSWSEIEGAFFLLLEAPPTPAAYQVMDAVTTLEQAYRSEFDNTAEVAWLQLQYWQSRLENNPDPITNRLITQETGFDGIHSYVTLKKPPSSIGKTKFAESLAHGSQQRQQLLTSTQQQALTTEIHQLQQTLDQLEAPYRKSHQEISKIISDIRKAHNLISLQLDLEVEISLFNQKARSRSADYQALKKEEQVLREKIEHLQQLENQYVKPIQNEWNQSQLYIPDETTKQKMLNLRHRVNEKTEQLMSGVYDQLLSQSTISVEEASSWAKQQDISPSVITRLKKAGYSKADLLKDMAEFYRLTGGRLNHVSLVTNGSDRAAANVGENVVFISGAFTKCTLFHEMAHLLENNPATKGMAQAFLNSRKEGPPQPLRQLTGNNNYRINEVAYPDSFIDPYVGKHYRDGSTEVMSMGIERFASPIKLYELLDKDPEMFDCMLGFLHNTSAAEQALSQQIRQQKNIDHDFYQQLFKQVKPIKVTEDYMASGPFTDFRFLKASTRDSQTRRKKTGRIVMTPQGQNELLESELEAKAWAYLYQLHQQGIQSQSIKHLKNLIMSRQAPDWFKSGMTIPSLP